MTKSTADLRKSRIDTAQTAVAAEVDNTHGGAPNASTMINVTVAGEHSGADGKVKKFSVKATGGLQTSEEGYEDPKSAPTGDKGGPAPKPAPAGDKGGPAQATGSAPAKA